MGMYFNNVCVIIDIPSQIINTVLKFESFVIGVDYLQVKVSQNERNIRRVAITFDRLIMVIEDIPEGQYSGKD